MRISQVILAAVLAAIFAGPVSAETICLKSRIKNGKLTTATAAVPDGQKCPKSFKALFSSTSITTLGGSGIQGLKGDTGAQGPQGVQGPKGDTGLQGAPGADGKAFSFVSASVISDSNSVSPKSITANCPANSALVSGQYGVIDGIGVPYNGPVAVSYAGGLILGNAFHVRAYETTATSDSWQMFALAICQAL